MSLSLACSALAGPTTPVRLATTGPDRRTAIFDVSAGEGGFVVARIDAGILVSQNHGRSWSAPVVGPAQQYSHVVASGTATIDVFWREEVSCNPCQTELRHARSSDAGRTWAGPHLVAASDFRTLLAVADDSSDRLALASEVLFGHTGGSVWVLSRSSDGGATWDGGNEAPNSPLAWFDVSRAIRCWKENTGTGSSEKIAILCSRSADGGRSFDAPAVVVETQAGSFESLEFQHLAAGRGTAHAAIVYLRETTRYLTLTDDGGKTWPRTLAVPVVPYWPYWSSLGVIDIDEQGLWFGLEIYGDGLHHELLRLDHGGSWREVGIPPELPLGPTRRNNFLLAATGPGSAVRIDTETSSSWRTYDGGQSWDDATQVAPFRAPVQDTLLVRRPLGDLLAVWGQGGGGWNEIRATVSSDGGATWQPSIRIDDAPPSYLRNAANGGYGSEALQMRAISVAAGGFAVLWVSRSPAAPAVVRVSRSLDGRTWQPSVALGEIDAFPLSLVEDVGGRLFASWTYENAMKVSTSLDGGMTWSPATTSSAPGEHRRQSGVIATSDGSLLLLEADGDNLVAWSSRDLGTNWSASPGGEADVKPFEIDIFESGDAYLGQLIGQVCPKFCSSTRFLLEGAPPRSGTLWSAAAGIPGDCRPLAPDGAGAMSWQCNQNEIWRQRSGVLPELVATTPFRMELSPGPGSVMMGPDELCLLHADWTDASPPGVFFRCLSVSPRLLRDATIGALEPRPDLAAHYPLPTYLASGVAPGITDPDAGVVKDATRPLVLYGLDPIAEGSQIQLGKTPAGELKITW